MKRVIFSDKTLLLEPGKYYNLYIIRIIDIPRSMPWFLVRDDNGLKHLMPYGYYSNFGIHPGDTIRCRLDRINCQGRFFFEPEHPYYLPGECYKFTLKCFNRNASDGINSYTATVIDIFGNELETLNFNMKPVIPRKINSLLCSVRSIKKAKPNLAVVDDRITGG